MKDKPMKPVFVIDENDNVATVVVEALQKGDEVKTNGRLTDIVVTANDNIAYGHKIALRNIKQGETVYKYGLSIGTATRDIRAGDHVHIHNVESNRGRGDKSNQSNVKVASS
jgi:altronate dehydratase small subunit